MKGSERRKQVGGFVKTKGQAVMMFSVHVDGMMGMRRNIRSRPGIWNFIVRVRGELRGLVVTCPDGRLQGHLVYRFIIDGHSSVVIINIINPQ